MAWRNEKTSNGGEDLVYDGVENGIALSPLKGTANIQNANIATDMGEIMASYARVLQQGTGTQASITNGTLTASVSDGTELLATSSTLKAGYWINISSSTIVRTNLPIDYLVVAGGGGGGGNSNSTGFAAGGGGAGGLILGNAVVSVTSYAVTVGAGGAGGSTAGTDGTNGSNSVIATIATAIGGGGGGGSANEVGKNGGSGGGAGFHNSGSVAGGTGTVGQGKDGGANSSGTQSGGGGGGYTLAGDGASPMVGGNGGNGVSYYITGSSVNYAGGGGGGSSTTAGTGGTGGGGGGGANANGTAATVNSGGGGGGAGGSGGGGVAHSGGAGGRGVVVVRYLTGMMTATGGTITTSGPYTIHTFTSSSTFQVTSATLSGNYFVSYQDTNGKIKISQFYDPLTTDVVIHGTSGTATFSTVTPTRVASPVAKATEKYQDSDSTEYRYYILDSSGYVWVYDTGAYDASLAASGVGTLWMIPDVTDYSADPPTGLAILNGWLCAVTRFTIKAKSTSRLGDVFDAMDGVTLMNRSTATTPIPHFAYVGHQGKMYYTDGNYLGEIFPTTSLATNIANVQSYSSWTTQTSEQIKLTNIISGSEPAAFSGSLARIPVVFFTEPGGSLPPLILPETVYWINPFDKTNGYFTVYNVQSGGASAITMTGGTGTQYFNTFYPYGQGAFGGSEPLVSFSNQRLNLPTFETATCMTEIGNILMIGGVTNTLYPWNQVDPLPSDIISLPEAGVKTMINVNNTAYVFAGNKGNIYIANNSVASLVYKVPDYCAGVPGSPLTYIEPYFVWGDAEYIRGRVYFSILDQTAIKAGNCGGVWSFVPSQNFSYGQDTGISLRLENQNSYGSYNGLATIILGNQEQNAIATQYWAGWQDSYSISTSLAFGIDTTNNVPVTNYVFETDLVNTGTLLSKETPNQIEYKLTTPLASGESVQLYYRLNATDAWTSCGTVIQETTNPLSGYFQANFQLTQWLQLRCVPTTNSLTTSSFNRLKELRVR